MHDSKNDGKSSWKRLRIRIQKFVFTGATGTIIDTLILWALTTYLFRGYVLTYIVAPAISFEFAMLKNYFFSYFWIWKDRVHRGYRDFFKRIPQYNLSVLLGFAVKLGGLLLLERFLHWNVVVLNVIALLLSGFVNFFLGEKLVFSHKRKNKGNDEHSTVTDSA